MMLSAEISLYPENTERGDEIVNRTIESLLKLGLECNVDHMATRISGDESKVWEGLKQVCKQADDRGEFSMVVTLTNH